MPEGRGRGGGFQPCSCLAPNPLACSFLTYKAGKPLVDGQWTEQAGALQTVRLWGDASELAAFRRAHGPRMPQLRDHGQHSPAGSSLPSAPGSQTLA